MATFLYRLGRWCADRAGRVIAAWTLILLAVAGSAAAFGTPAANQFSIPGSNFQRVMTELGDTIPELRGGFGTVVFESSTGSFTPAQKDAIKAAEAQWAKLPHVTSVMNPFVVQDQLNDSRAKLDKAKIDLDKGFDDLAANRTKLDQAHFKLAQGQGLIRLAQSKNPKDPGLKTLRPQVADAEYQLAEGERKWSEGRDKLAAAWTAYEQGRSQIEAMDGMRFVTDDGRYAVAQIQFDTNAPSVPYEVRAQIPEIGAALSASGVTATYSSEISQELSLVGPGEVIGLAIALMVLVVMLGTLIAAGLPIAGALLGVGVGLGGAVAATHFFTMNQMTPSLALMLGLAVGIDYALFIVNKHRQLYLHGTDLRASIGRAVGTAGSAVAFAGATVVIALAALVLSGIPMLAQMGLVAAATVAVSVLAALTLTPALLRLLGPRVASKRTWRASGYAVPGDHATRTSPEHDHEEEHGGWYVGLATRRPWLTIAGVVALVAVLAAPALTLRLGLPDGGTEPRGSTAYATYQTVASEFGKGMNGPILAVATLERPPATAAELRATQSELATRLAGVTGVRSVAVAGVSDDKSVIALQVVPVSGPADAETVDTVHALSDRLAFIGAETGSTIGITGQTVANIEISQRLADALPGYLATVVGLSLVILLLVFRSVVVPVIATAGFLLSVAAAFGVTVAVYQWGWLASIFGVSQPGPIMSFTPIILIGVLFGLAMDYQMFMVSGMREAHVHGEPARRAVRTGFLHGAKVVTAAALIMFSVFGGFVFSHLTMIRPIGLSLAVGVIVDAVLVRMTLTPAIMHLLGERAWWLPGWLDRLVPNVDVEGAGLTAHLAREEAAPAEHRELVGSR